MRGCEDMEMRGIERMGRWKDKKIRRYFTNRLYWKNPACRRFRELK